MRSAASHFDDYIKLSQNDPSVKGKNFVSVKKILEASPQVTLILGNQGAGKTYLAYQLHHFIKDSHYLLGSSGTTLYNFTKFIHVHLNVDMNHSSEHTVDPTTALVTALSQVHQNQTILIDNVDQLPQNTMNAILQIIAQRPCIHFILFGKPSLPSYLAELAPHLNQLPTHHLQPLNDKEIRQMLLIQYDIKLSLRKLKHMKTLTHGIPGNIEQYIDHEKHAQMTPSKFFSWKRIYTFTKYLFLLLSIGGLVFFSYQYKDQIIEKIWPTPPQKNYQFVVNSSSIFPMLNDSPKICLPKMGPSEKNGLSQSFLPIYAIQLVGVKNPSSIQSIDKSIKKLSPAPILVKQKTPDGLSDWYVLYYGPFFKKESAQKALGLLPPELKAFNPWLKQIETADIFKS